jgi:hypothetical protein
MYTQNGLPAGSGFVIYYASGAFGPHSELALSSPKGRSLCCVRRGDGTSLHPG